MHRTIVKIFILSIILTTIVPHGVVNNARAAVTPNVSLNMPANSLGLVGYWTMDGPDITWTSDTAGTATDSSGSGFTGTLTSMSKSVSPVVGRIGQALDLDGSADYVDMSNVLDNDGSSAMTISAWIKMSGTSDTIVSKMSNSGDQTGYRILVDSAGTFGFTIQQVSASDRLVVNGTSVVNNGQWHHLLVTYDGSKTLAGVIRYVDNSVDAVSSSADQFTGSSSNAISFNIGSRNDGADTLFDGIVDDVRVYNRALSPTEVSRLYQLGGTTRINKSIRTNSELTNGLVGHWTLDGPDITWTSDTAGTATDLSGSGFTGTLTSMSKSVSPVTGRIGQALDLDGSADYVDMGNVLDNDGSSAMTISAWIKT